MKPLTSALIASTLCIACSEQPHSESDLTHFVDPLIGTADHGHVFVGANVPFGMVQLGPTSIPQAWDWTSGYHDSDSSIIGFSHTHLSGTGIGDLFDITVMPVIGNVTYARGHSADTTSGLWSYGVRSQQIVTPGYYSVPLKRYGINVELTATCRAGMHRYSFPATDSAAIIFDLQNGGCWDRPTSVEITAQTDTTITGHRFSTGWSNDQKVFFAAQFSQPFDSLTLHGAGNMYGRLHFPPSATPRTILVKVALSPTSVEAAMANLQAEIPSWDFDSVATAAKRQWNDNLSGIIVETTDTAELTKFYTALYHSYFFPTTFCDVDSAPSFTIFSLWDTYRAQMPLLSITQPNLYPQIINSMLDIYDTQGRLPVWHLWGCETDCMVGNPGIIPVSDAIVKHISGIDPRRALKAAIATATDTIRGGGLRDKYGYIPCNLFNEAVAYDMEYAIADAAIAAAATAVGDTAAAGKFSKRSHSYRTFYDSSTGFIRGRDDKGNMRTPFDPYSTTHRVDDYCEGNAWQYSWLAPHDIDGLIELRGSKDATIAALDSLFTADTKLTGDASPDITGLIGQYVHGNEPSHHIPYFYTMLGQPRKAAEIIKRILDTLYTTQPDGLCGNEDAGQMSAWYIFSALGFYPVEPASARYWFGTPRFPKATIRVPGGNFTIIAKGLSSTAIHIKSATINGNALSAPYITHKQITDGGTLVLEMTE